MAPTLQARQGYGYGNGNCGYNSAGQYVCGGSSWSNWARWLVLGLIILGAILIFFLFSCLTARRRRKMGYQPYRGTGWALGRAPPGHGQATYDARPQQEQTAMPHYNNNSNSPYNANPPAYGAAGDYYGGNNVEMQPPQPVYGANQARKADQYAPPMGPPPGR
ncbi:hypothetical protein LTR29_002680 [Friedmanniomyces endolithicus]|uniref:Protein RCR2 n=1 Tax=Friedmanniomyces endolithicus TaxID=329885 RepID=A0A4U0VK74_9PEZI|nr:hypothetical protein LTS09_012151 [Friedmanniomyces endolithicus]KAK0315514.1 hypothetical protein LTR01_000814 [Friedmanniomyces endolithicus]KAK0826992.1 hypothetical protein LTR73_005773 [Friedmanniomyces endolithicus]KAK0945823.1 hypothetical protein LTR29_002680 [Friedmanniomyces endolithicus]TKA49710.1 hypothetical protein B0A54_00379 [Friedmanniomyces endolithicus]